jgi:hypothetical protein
MLRARVTDTDGRKTKVSCQVVVNGITTVVAEVLGVRVVEGKPDADSPFR